ncbi:MAG: bifunctional 2-polyprenyl-6-hydroxyphenol methylase/3-demethylubiquinol 3-O-methyltransferase UbiG [Cyanobacteria bacterium J06631_9]
MIDTLAKPSASRFNEPTPMQRNNLSYYDQWATQWWQAEATVAPLNRLNPLRFQFFDRYVSDWRSLKVLDVGCGGGFTSEFLARRGAHVTGIDQSLACVEAASHHASETGLSICYQQSQAEQLPFNDATFDSVVCVDVLEHVDSPLQTIAEISRVLKPGGQFCFDTINRTWRSKLVMIWLLENALGQIPKGIHDWQKFITPAELSDMLGQHSMTIQEISGFDLFGGGLLGSCRRLLKYYRTGQFHVDFDSNNNSTQVMYIGVAIKR